MRCVVFNILLIGFVLTVAVAWSDVHGIPGERIMGQEPMAETISLDSYERLRTYYAQPEHRRPEDDPNGWEYEVQLVRFDDKTATAGIVRGVMLKTSKGKAWEWVRRFEFERGPEVDSILGITGILTERAMVIGGVKSGMTVTNVIRLKGLHYKELPHQLVGSAGLAYDDVIVSVAKWHQWSDSGVVTRVGHVPTWLPLYHDELPYEDDVVKVYGKAPAAETISLGEYEKLKVFYGLAENHWADLYRRIPQFVRLVRFDDKTATAGMLRENGKNGLLEWIRRFEFTRSADVDKALGVTEVVDRRSRVIGGVKWGMSWAEVIALKGRHYKLGHPQRAAAVIMCYDDVVVSSYYGRFVENVREGDGNQGDEMKKLPYVDEMAEGQQDS